MSSWNDLVSEAIKIGETDDFMTDYMGEYFRNQPTFLGAVSHLLAKQFTSNFSYEKWYQLFTDVCTPDTVYNSGMESIEKMAFLDLSAIKERDPACDGLVHPFLYSKGFKAIQCHRIAHVLWNSGRKGTALAVHSRCCELYNIDIHPGAIIGESMTANSLLEPIFNLFVLFIDSGLLLDHGTGVVIGGTATIGKNCSFLHGVTLGATGKEKGDRHPKVGNDVLIGCNASLLGNITIGDSCKIGSGSIVLRSLPKCVTAVGNPAKIVGTSLCFSAAASMDVALHNVVTSSGVAYDQGWSQFADGI